MFEANITKAPPHLQLGPALVGAAIAVKRLRRMNAESCLSRNLRAFLVLPALAIAVKRLRRMNAESCLSRNLRAFLVLPALFPQNDSK